MQPLQLINGDFALISSEDLVKCMKFRWQLNSRGYVRIAETENSKDIFLHNFVLDLPAGSGVDHINRDKLDNRRENLRFADRTQQIANQGLTAKNTLGFKGISIMTTSAGRIRYVAKLQKQKKTVCLGNYNTPEEAAKAYDEGAKVHFGPYACTNESLGLFNKTRATDYSTTLNFEDED